ncbi:M14 family metallopeptidase [Flavobacterium sp. HXWNR69]|uniref:M14 family metallopeptidase n=1 Tax=Flavobacterium fragile TaxID=2949085 RepID=A0ABT0TJ32_9FLAO|nr:M14 metallopeptidase family protein [Flavobacterium sp. HXWNR69]MCL9770979.1 M14 family metallopeptidase [Flavobacterium sp. HXWNR69]
MDYLQLATHYLESQLKGKYIHLEVIQPLLLSMSTDFEISEIGMSVQKRSIYQVKIGTGKKKIMMWSQMHGNEPTTTKGLFDFFNFLKSDHELANWIISEYTLLCIPMLNPDGAYLYTRENANKIDLNRDALYATQPEMQLLKKIYNDFQPDFCYNLHDQRSIFGTEGFNLPATISFLAPAYNDSRDYNDVRLKAVQVINRMNTVLQNYLPNQIGRFDDSYNINCTGDYFTTQNTPTILFEAGHYENDYDRDISRKFIFIALLSSLELNCENVIVNNELTDYLNIPQNNKCFYDIIYKNVKIIDSNVEKIINFAAQYKESLTDEEVQFIAYIEKVGDLDHHKGHLEYDCNGGLFSSEFSFFPKNGDKANFFINNLTHFFNGLEII